MSKAEEDKKGAEVETVNAVDQEDVVIESGAWDACNTDDVLNGDDVGRNCDNTDETENIGNIVESVNPKRVYDRHYKKEEDARLLTHILNHELQGLTGGNAMWKRLEQQQVLPGRSWQSMKGRFSLLQKKLELSSPSRTSTPERALRNVYGECRRQPYSLREDLAIINFIVMTGQLDRVKGLRLWQDMAVILKNELGRSAESMKTRFLKHILPNQSRYATNLSDLIALLKADNQDEVDNDAIEVVKDDEDVAEVVNEMTTKHPLQHTWTLWYFRNDKRRDWSENLLRVVDVSSVEDFWCVVNHTRRPSELAVGCEYSFFKAGVEPKWEHSANRSGGRWSMQFKKNEGRMVDQAWTELLLALIGEALSGPGVNGAVVQMKGAFARLSLWLAHAEEEQKLVLDVGKRLKRIVGVQERINFIKHEDSMSRTSSKVKIDLQV